jgi:hypothetical protein
MSKRYTLFLADGFEDTFAKKDSAIRAGAKSGQSFHILSPAGAIVYPTAPSDPEATAPATEEPVTPQDVEDLIGDPEPVSGTGETRTFPGNYAPNMVKLAENLAVAFSDDLETSTSKGSGLARNFHVTGPADVVKEFLIVLDRETEDVKSGLHTWQKENADKRRGLTDMQKFNQHRAFIDEYGEKKAKQIARGVS